MKKTFVTLLIAVVLVFSTGSSVFAAEGQPPQGSCPAGFALHLFGEHEHPEEHDHHIGLVVDLNGDGSICVKVLSDELHVHTDNVLR